jgi:hypothetical protein
MNKSIAIKCRIIKETDFWITVRLKESGMIIDLMKKDIVKEIEKIAPEDYIG